MKNKNIAWNDLISLLYFLPRKLLLAKCRDLECFSQIAPCLETNSDALRQQASLSIGSGKNQDLFADIL